MHPSARCFCVREHTKDNQVVYRYNLGQNYLRKVASWRPKIVHEPLA